MMGKLNAKQKLFVSHYVIDRNASKAAIAAGYPKAGARTQGPRLLRNVAVAAAIDKQLSKLTEKSELTAELVLAEIRKLAFVDMTKAYAPDGTLLPLDEMPEDVRKALVSIESDDIIAGRGAMKKKIGYVRKIKLADKVRSLEMLAKHFKMLTDVTQLQNPDGSAVQVNLTMPANGSESADATLNPVDPSETPTEEPST